jgi:glycosyltransferase involved in cell wall biosynthesis
MAVAGTEVRGIRQVIRHRETGLLCGTGAEQLRGAVSRLLEDAALRRRLGRAAREQVVAAHSLEKVAAAELAVLRELA